MPEIPLSLTGKRWNVRERTSGSAESLVGALFRERNLDQQDDAPSFPDMGAAVARIRRALTEAEIIGIFGDYDCDGITATAQLSRFFARRGVTPVTILPHRVRDGYGLSPESIDRFVEKGVSLVITVDTGITALQAVDYAIARGIDVIVTDHHALKPELPRACAILHPALGESCEPHPSGAGVALLLVRALEEGVTYEGSGTDDALAAIGTVADLVELRGFNRSLVSLGLRALNTMELGPLTELKKTVAGKHLTSRDIAFRIAPRINAAGRMDDPLHALRALLEGGEALSSLHAFNLERQKSMELLERSLLSRFALTDVSLPAALPPFLVAAGEDYPEGIVGLLAGKLTERTGRPSLVATIRGEHCTGSLRAPKGYHVTDALARSSHLLTSYGGHAQAAGCSFELKHLPKLREALECDVRSSYAVEDLVPAIDIDAEISPEDLSIPFALSLRELEPYGQGNREPTFLLRNAHIESLRACGAAGAHVQGRIAGRKLIAFRLGHLLPKLGEPLDIACRISLEHWQGREEVQVVVEDVRVADSRIPNKQSGEARVSRAPRWSRTT